MCSGRGTNASFGGGLSVSHGTGRYAHTHGSGGLYGTVNRHTDDLSRWLREARLFPRFGGRQSGVFGYSSHGGSRSPRALIKQRLYC
jgi:hypothetical protein